MFYDVKYIGTEKRSMNLKLVHKVIMKSIFKPFKKILSLWLLICLMLCDKLKLRHGQYLF